MTTGLPSEYHLLCLNSNRLHPSYVAALVLKNRFANQLFDLAGGVHQSRFLLAVEGRPPEFFLEHLQYAIVFLAKIDAAESLRGILRYLLRQETLKLPISAVVLNGDLAAAVDEAVSCQSLNVLRMFFEFPKDPAYNPRKGIRVPGPRAALARQHGLKSVEVMRLIFSDPRGNLPQCRRKVVSQFPYAQLELIPAMLQEFCTPDDILGELDPFSVRSMARMASDTLLQILNDERMELNLIAFQVALGAAARKNAESTRRVIDLARQLDVDLFKRSGRHWVFDGIIGAEAIPVIATAPYFRVKESFIRVTAMNGFEDAVLMLSSIDR
ncbi:hypothetical protein HDU96_006532 [Phlyctochytrium bullatum]|nr:hypothetical protein HDU96_006532 [Phlyctochytrium bullatum]